MDIFRAVSIFEKVVNIFFLAALNIAMVSLAGYLTLDASANLNSRLGALFIAFLLPYFIASKTRQMTGLERMIKFGTGYFAYAVSSIWMLGIPQPIVTGLVPCLVLSLGVLFYGNKVGEI